MQHFSVVLTPPVIGIITDEDGNPLSGINIIVKGTSIGAVTDANGKLLVGNEDFSYSLNRLF